jgi:hypothetical protein
LIPSIQKQRSRGIGDLGAEAEVYRARHHDEPTGLRDATLEPDCQSIGRERPQVDDLHGGALRCSLVQLPRVATIGP